MQLWTAITSGHDANKYLPVALVISSFIPQRRSPFINACDRSTTTLSPPPFGRRLESLALSPLSSPFTDHILRRHTENKKVANASPFFLIERLAARTPIITNFLRVRSSSDVSSIVFRGITIAGSKERFQEQEDNGPISRPHTREAGDQDSQDSRFFFFYFEDAKRQRCPATRPRWLSRALGPPYIDPTLAKLAKRERLYFFLSHYFPTYEHGDSRERFIPNNETRPSSFFFFVFIVSRYVSFTLSPRTDSDARKNGSIPSG